MKPLTTADIVDITQYERLAGILGTELGET